MDVETFEGRKESAAALVHLLGPHRVNQPQGKSYVHCLQAGQTYNVIRLHAIITRIFAEFFLLCWSRTSSDLFYDDGSKLTCAIDG